MGTKCWIAVVYDWGDEGLTLAKTTDPGLLNLARRCVIQEAEDRLAISSQIDDVIAMLDEIELDRLHRTLSKLIPQDTDET